MRWRRDAGLRHRAGDDHRTGTNDTPVANDDAVTNAEEFALAGNVGNKDTAWANAGDVRAASTRVPATLRRRCRGRPVPLHAERRLLRHRLVHLPGDRLDLQTDTATVTITVTNVDDTIAAAGRQQHRNRRLVLQQAANVTTERRAGRPAQTVTSVTRGARRSRSHPFATTAGGSLTTQCEWQLQLHAADAGQRAGRRCVECSIHDHRLRRRERLRRR